MAKRQSESSVHVQRAGKSAKPTKRLKDRNIDYSDIPESTDEELMRARRVGRPVTGQAKQLIAIRVSPKVLQELKRIAAKADKPYQTLINELLESAVKKSA